MSKLEEVFNLPELIDELEETADDITEAFKDHDEKNEIGNVDHLLAEFKGSLSNEDMANIADLKKYDEEMDDISKKTLAEFDDLMALGKDVETRHAGEIFSAAAQMAKIALDAKTNKVNSKLKILELSIRRKRNDLLEQKQNHEFQDAPAQTGTATQLTRDDLIKIAQEMNKGK